MWMLIINSYFIFPQYSILWSQLTGFVLYHYQAYFCKSLYLLLLLGLKHFLCWVGTGLLYEKIQIHDLWFFIEMCIFSLSQQLICFFLEYHSQVSMFISRVEIKSLHEKLNTIVNVIDDFIAVISKNKQVLFMNPAATKEFGQKPWQEVLKDFVNLRGNNGDELSSLVMQVEKFLSGQDYKETVNFGLTSKGFEFFEWSGKGISWDGEEVLMLTGKNVTKIVQLEKENRENSYRSVLINTVSHELRTPTNAIMLLGGQIKDSEELSKPNNEKLDIILASCAFQLCLINDLLDYAQIVAGCLKVSKTPFSIQSLILEVSDYIKIQLNPSIQFIQSSDLLPDKVISDPNRLKQIILNLLANARKFTTQGYITLEVQFVKPKLFVSCTDTGIGIPADKLNQLFKEFGKIEQSFSLTQNGVGLGLFISNMLVKELGGQGIKVQSKPGVGSCFSFFILAEASEGAPLEVPDENTCVRIPTLNIKHACNRDRKVKILIVDDIYFNILAFVEIFKAEGFSCEFAMNGEKALELVRVQSFDVILMDCEMPIMDGWEATEKMVEMEKSRVIKKLPTVLGTTAHTDIENTNKCLKSGMRDVVIKPCPKESIIRIVKHWVSLMD